MYPQKSQGSSGSESIDQREIPSWLGMPKGTWWLKGEREREREREREEERGLASVDFQIMLSVALWALDYISFGSLFVVVDIFALMRFSEQQ